MGSKPGGGVGHWQLGKLVIENQGLRIRIARKRASKYPGKQPNQRRYPGNKQKATEVPKLAIENSLAKMADQLGHCQRLKESQL
jgi:hypothetical protein